MIRNIKFPEVENVSIAIVPSEKGEEVWKVFLINQNNFELKNILVNSRGYGQKNEKKVETGTLKHFIEKIEPMSFTQIESIHPDVFGLTNQYWLSFYAQEKLFDKKYVFTSGAIDSKHFTVIPLLELKGVLHP